MLQLARSAPGGGNRQRDHRHDVHRQGAERLRRSEQPEPAGEISPFKDECRRAAAVAVVEPEDERDLQRDPYQRRGHGCRTAAPEQIAAARQDGVADTNPQRRGRELLGEHADGTHRGGERNPILDHPQEHPWRDRVDEWIGPVRIEQRDLNAGSERDEPRRPIADSIRKADLSRQPRRADGGDGSADDRVDLPLEQRRSRQLLEDPRRQDPCAVERRAIRDEEVPADLPEDVPFGDEPRGRCQRGNQGERRPDRKGERRPAPAPVQIHPRRQ